ncbi:cytochrome-c peroxidase [Sinorhizobium meliloti]|uniref:cytochrome-c peroxidase n=1 Tax=Rhizobium meliloti TaxID=382 RepID=UPI002380B2BC|nr:cytochrome c peroxidase [Sinorhizobium meliloti]MDE3820114.1 methylamine utilization protein [Sinorhizobium meliloti]
MRKVLFALPLVAATAAALAAGVPATSGTGWSEEEIALARSLSLEALPPVPDDPSNRVADDPRAVALGRALFFDARFSSTGDVACVTCHLPERQFQDDRPLGRGVGQTGRRTMPIAGTAHSPFLFWDGRKDSLWAQALGPLESPVEHGGDRTQYARLITEHYRKDYEAVFGSLPDFAALPANAGPNAAPKAAAAWTTMEDEDRNTVNVVFANIGKAIAAFERTIAPSETRFDTWVASAEFPAPGLLSEEEVAGLRLFIGKGQCITCHNGPLLTDNHFHNTGVPAVLGLPQDKGRESGARLVREDIFNCLGPYSDAEPDQCSELRFMAPEDHSMRRAFKTPSLRGAASRRPYMHAGQIQNLTQVIAHYVAAPKAPAGHSELRPLDMDEQDRRNLEAFLLSLDEVR